MATDYRTTVLQRWREFLNSRPSNNNVTALGVPLGELVDIAIDTLTEGEGVPRVPRYDPELFAQMRWAEPLDVTRAEMGEGFTTISVDRADQNSDTTDGARFVLTDGLGQEHIVCLPSDMADQLALATLSVTRENARVGA